MSETDEIHRADDSSRASLTYAPTHINCTGQYGLRDEHSMNDDASGFGVRLAVQPCETSCSHRIRNRVRRGIVWQAAYGVWLAHTPGVAASQLGSNHSRHALVSSSPMKPHIN